MYYIIRIYGIRYSNKLWAKFRDRIFLESFIPDRDGEYVRVKGIIEQSLGINGYMNINYLNQKFLDKGIINGIYINSNDRVKAKLADINNIMSTQSQGDMQGIFYFIYYSCGYLLQYFVGYTGPV